MNCQSCHTSFPRLNAFGEKFAKNGYQLPGSEDGDETKKKLNDTTFIDGIGNLFGIRIAVSPVEVVTDGLTVDGAQKLKVGLGDTKWVQLFTAGSIFKNTSIFIETEVGGDKTIKFNWYTLGYHNLLGSSWLNLRAGQLSMLNWAAQTGRLRMIPNISLTSTSSKTSQGTNKGTAEDVVSFGGAMPAVELYGYNDYALVSVGIANGSALTDKNQFKNYFGTLRFELPEGALAGSAISGSGVIGKDTLTSKTAQQRNEFWMAQPAVNLRWESLDLIASYILTKEKNFNLNAADIDNKRQGYSGQLGYLISPTWYAALQYDKVKDDVKSTEEFHKVSQNLTYMPRENMRIGLTLREELRKNATGKQHEVLLHVRAMF